VTPQAEVIDERPARLILRIPRADLWFDYLAPQDGVAEIETCAADPVSAPDTSLIVYDGCVCPTVLGPVSPVLCCSDDAGGACGSASRCTFEIVAGACYKVRVADEGGSRPSGRLLINSRSGGPCPPGTVEWIDPPPNVVDAGIPVDPAAPTTSLGIDRIVVRAPPDSMTTCWDVCAHEPAGGENAIMRQERAQDGTTTLVLRRPITPGAVTLVRYLDDAGQATEAAFAAMPGDVNGDGKTSPADVLELVDVLNGITGPAWSAYSTDVDRSGVTQAADVLAIIDLLYGAAPFQVWNGRIVVPPPAECP